MKLFQNNEKINQQTYSKSNIFKLDKHECCPNLVISGSEDVNVLYSRLLGSYKGHGRPNKRKAYQIENSTFHFEWRPEYRRFEYGRFAWSVSIVKMQDT